METQYGSLTRGMLAAHKQMRAKAKHRRRAASQTSAANAGRSQRETTGRGIFTTLRGGMQQLVDAIEATARAEFGATVSTPVDALERIGERMERQGGRFVEMYDAVILASPAWAAGTLLGAVDAELRRRNLQGFPTRRRSL